MKLLHIPLDQIDVPEDRLRKVSMPTIKSIASDLTGMEAGMINPITVWRRKSNGRYVLIAGEHRILAAKLAKWTAINATHWDWQLENPDEPDDVVALQARYVEAAENVKRHNLTAADLAYMDGVLKKVTDEIVALRLQHQREKALAEKEAAVQAAADEKARKKAQEELREAKRNAGKRERRGAENENGSQKRHHGAYGGESVKVVAEQTGRSEFAVRKSVRNVNTVGGLDIAGQLRGTALSSNEEMQAFGELRKLAPDEADRILKSALKHHQVSAVAVLKEIKADIRKEQQRQKDEAAKTNHEAAIIQLAEECGGIRGEAQRLKGRVKALKLDKRIDEIDRIIVLLDAIATKARQARAVQSAIR